MSRPAHAPLAAAMAALALAACDDDSTPSEPLDTDSADTSDVGDDTGSDASSDAADTSVDAAEDPDTTPPLPTCWDDLEVGDVVAFTETEETTEGAAFGNDGRFYVSSEDEVLAIDAEGIVTAFADVPTALGIARASDGLIVASIGESVVKGVADGAVYHVTDAGTVSLIADGIDSPNFVVVTPEGHALVSDDFDTRVWLVKRDGSVSEAITEIASPNGMGYTPAQDALIVASTFSPRAEITSVPVDANGVPTSAARTEIAELGVAQVPDGLAVGASGDVYVLANIAGTIVRVPADGSDTEVVANGLGNPASAAFGEGEGFDPCSLYVTNLTEKTIYRVFIGEPGVQGLTPGPN